MFLTISVDIWLRLNMVETFVGRNMRLFKFFYKFNLIHLSTGMVMAEDILKAIINERSGYGSAKLPLLLFPK